MMIYTSHLHRADLEGGRRRIKMAASTSEGVALTVVVGDSPARISEWVSMRVRPPSKPRIREWVTLQIRGC